MKRLILTLALGAVACDIPNSPQQPQRRRGIWSGFFHGGYTGARIAVAIRRGCGRDQRAQTGTRGGIAWSRARSSARRRWRTGSPRRSRR